MTRLFLLLHRPRSQFFFLSSNSYPFYLFCEAIFWPFTASQIKGTFLFIFHFFLTFALNLSLSLLCLSPPSWSSRFLYFSLFIIFPYELSTPNFLLIVLQFFSLLILVFFFPRPRLPFTLSTLCFPLLSELRCWIALLHPITLSSAYPAPLLLFTSFNLALAAHHALFLRFLSF